MKKTESNREMTVNHILYPGEKAKLRDRIAILLNKNNQEDITKLISVNKEISSDPVYSIVSPHGGWGYCDKIMASAYRSIMKKEFKTIIILGRVHREPSKALFLPNFTSYDTPLGEVNVDQSILGEISGSDKLFQYNNIPHIEEHSIDVQLPFIKYLWPAAKIVPILTGKSLKSLTRILTETLKGVLQKEAGETLIVISSGLSSYNNYETIKTETDNFISILKSPENWK
ncbi:MAG: AmmeMemoRadiSam system protein B, partial [Spirochaetales bacterium]|nr:AmmeMemoRadiSam system protein B [Spirochaetales bacterium]